MIETPEFTETDEQAAAVIHLTIPREEMQDAFGPAVHELIEVLAEQGVEPAGPVFAHHLEIDPQTFDFEVGVPVSEPVEETGRVKRGSLPAATVARTVYRGPYEGLPDAWGEFESWIEDRGRSPAPDAWERYVVDPASDPDPANWRTELVRPLID